MAWDDVHGLVEHGLVEHGLEVHGLEVHGLVVHGLVVPVLVLPGHATLGTPAHAPVPVACRSTVPVHRGSRTRVRFDIYWIPIYHLPLTVTSHDGYGP